ncbi:NUDIX hydrolase [Streptomyces kaniharaensis]|uniref:NUDIX hydrolase n=2 Tax=Streptomyces kaniharaensis TaxID=212423 RepID=A0A6N7KWL4_9ACTN|nr:NUDIX hydrolase [Streptomyces kaniharaensis]
MAGRHGPRAYIGASVMVTDPAGRVLLLKPPYRDTWGWPGGMIDHGETPAACAVRELREETGLVLEVRPLVIEWRDPIPAQNGHAHPAVHFMFDAGTTPADTPIQPQPNEVADHGFFLPDQAAALLHEHGVQRLIRGLQARTEGATVLLHTPGYLG